jgi:hypothetical protein
MVAAKRLLILADGSGVVEPIPTKGAANVLLLNTVLLLFFKYGDQQEGFEPRTLIPGLFPSCSFVGMGFTLQPRQLIQLYWPPLLPRSNSFFFLYGR